MASPTTNDVNQGGNSSELIRVLQELLRHMDESLEEDSLDSDHSANAEKASRMNVSKSTIDLLKANEEEHTLTAIVYPAKPLGWSDSQGDWVHPDQIKKMAYDFMAKSQYLDLHHRVLDVSKNDAVVVESWIAPVDFDWPQENGDTYHVTKGSWIVTTHFPSDTLWDRVKKGEFGGYSIRGRGKRRPIESQQP
jgi:hypothetical protein